MGVAILKWLWFRRWYVVIIVASAACMIALGVRLWRAQEQADDYQRQLASYDAVVEIHEGAYLAQTAQLDLAETLIREYSPQPTMQVAYQAAIKVVTKTRTIRVPVVETKLVYRDDNIDISGDISCDGGEGGTCPVLLPADAAINLAYTLAPLKIDLFVTRIKGQYQTIVDTHALDVAVEMQTRLDPAVFQDDRPWFAGVGPMVRLHGSKAEYSWWDLGLAVSAGYLFNRWYIQAQAMYLDGFGVGVMFGGRW